MSQEYIAADIETCLHPEYVQLATVAVFWRRAVLLVHRESEPFKGLFSIPGETYQAAARRELFEETGIKAEQVSALKIFIDHDNRIECHGFLYHSPDGQFANPPNEEQEVIGWRTLEEARSLPLTPGLSEFLLAS